jgi:DNA-binding NtrC family response regulator
MAIARDSDPAVVVIIFENDPHQATAYRELFADAGYEAQTALPNQDVQHLCERGKPQLVVVDMAIWEADTAYIFGVLNGALGFERPVIIALATLPHQVRRAKKFGADNVWIRGVDDAAGLPQLAGDLLQQRREGKLKPRVPSTPL